MSKIVKNVENSQFSLAVDHHIILAYPWRLKISLNIFENSVKMSKMVQKRGSKPKIPKSHGKLSKKHGILYGKISKRSMR